MADLEALVQRKLGRAPEFLFDGRKLPYFFHSYNNFGITERSIEIPIAKDFLRRQASPRVLEIGNVSAHYYDMFRDAILERVVVDRFETGPDVINQDVAEYLPVEKFSTAFSISTFEHMDADLGRNPTYIPGRARLGSVAADNIRYVGEHCLESGGCFLITAPLGYTPEWDWTFNSGVLEKCGFREVRRFLLKRTAELSWGQVPLDVGLNVASSAYARAREFLSVVELQK